MTRREAWRTFRDGMIIGFIIACAIDLAIRMAHAQDSGFSIQPDGAVTQWNAQSRYTAGPSGTAAWNAQGGYVAPTGGGYQSWSGPALPVVPSEPQQFLLPIVPDVPQP